MRGVLLVEGDSDRAAVETIAQRRGHDLAASGIRVTVMGGATNIRHYLTRFGPDGQNLALAGLYDLGEERFFRRALQPAGAEPFPPLAELGFFLCDRDLEDEMLRAIGIDGVLAIVDEQGEMDAFASLCRQPAHRERTTHQQLHRFLDTKSGRKIRYGRLLAEAVPADRVPEPLLGVLDHLQQRVRVLP